MKIPLPWKFYKRLFDFRKKNGILFSFWIKRENVLFEKKYFLEKTNIFPKSDLRKYLLGNFVVLEIVSWKKQGCFLGK